MLGFTGAFSSVPSEYLNFTLFLGVLCFGIMGAARGIDEGLIGGTIRMQSFKEAFGLTGTTEDNALRIGIITSTVQLGSVPGALIAPWISDRFGRVLASQVSTIVWMIGTAIYLSASASGSFSQLIAGRIIMGLGIGQTTVIAPTYLAEVSPKIIRGACMCVFSGSVYLAVMLAYFANWGASLHLSEDASAQWIVPTGCLHYGFAGIIFTTSWFVVESPRWLASRSKNEAAKDAMFKLRNLATTSQKHNLVDEVNSEVAEICDTAMEQNSYARENGVFKPYQELFVVSSNRKRMVLALACQLLGQWSGASSITIYAPEFFEQLNVTGQNEKLMSTAVLGVVKFVASLVCAVYLIDKIGRKLSLTTGISFQTISMMYIASYLTAVGTGMQTHLTEATKNAGTAGVFFIYFSGFGWALGFNSIQYLISAEILPARLRSKGGSLIMAFHFLNQFASSKAVPHMRISMGDKGVFWFFSGVTVIAFLFALILIPNTAGIQLEDMDDFFSRGWLAIGRGPAPAPRRGDLGSIEMGNRNDSGSGSLEKDASASVERIEMMPESAGHRRESQAQN